ncbi:MAG: hypothetical protein GQ557_00665 [Mycoplasmataceae bacterium]|nr:hypothetical protein [Mycoplasmataceae bacterium]
MEHLGYIFSEFLGTFMLILIGLGVNANVSLKKTHGSGSGWIVITWGWSMGVLIGATVALYSGGQLNPAVTIGLLMAKQLTFVQATEAIVGELLGAFVAASLIVFLYWNHFKETDDQGAIGGTFFTSPAIESPTHNFFAEVFGTFVLMGAILASIIFSNQGSFILYGPLFAALAVFAIGMSLGGLTGYSINPARDLMPRLTHHLMPIPNKGSSNWNYSWVPIIGPIVGALFAVAVSYLGLAMATNLDWETLGNGSQWGLNSAGISQNIGLSLYSFNI